MALGLAPALWVAAIVIFVAHLGGGTQWALSTYGLQVLVPDYIRGRVFAVDFALITLSLGHLEPGGGRRSRTPLGRVSRRSCSVASRSAGLAHGGCSRGRYGGASC